MENLHFTLQNTARYFTKYLWEVTVNEGETIEEAIVRTTACYDAIAAVRLTDKSWRVYTKAGSVFPSFRFECF